MRTPAVKGEGDRDGIVGGKKALSASYSLVLAGDPIEQPVRLAQPSRTTLLYRQRGASFERYPADAPLLEQVIGLGPSNG